MASAHRQRTLRQSLEEYGRGVAGGLLFSMPLLYTMEVWWAGFLLGSLELLGLVGITLLLLLAYNRFAGMRQDANWFEVAIDSVEEMGLGLVLSAVVLFLLDRITWQMPPSEVLGKVVLESMTVAIGVSVGTAQLGGGNGGNSNGKQGNGKGNGKKGGQSDSPENGEQDTGTQGDEKPPTNPQAQWVLALCGAVLFAANIAPTEEIVVLGAETPPEKLLGIAALSLLLGAVILHYSSFLKAERHTPRDGWWTTIGGLTTSYVAALIAAAAMLWFFGRFEDMSLNIMLAQTVVLGLPAMLGASAGRLLIQ